MIINGAHLTPSSSGAMELSVLERQRVALKWHQHHLQPPQQQQAYFGDFSMLPLDTHHNFHGGLQEGASVPPIKPDPGLMESGSGSGSGWTDYASTTTTTTATTRTDSCPPGAAKQSFRKRKAELNNTLLPPKAETESENRAKKVKSSCKEDQSVHKKADQSIKGKCKEASEAQKLDYIHVRARRGQATDSHSLAERVRREKISERMKCLQDLVPGCNKITGKAGMLDEIINYVQSLQRQVEFLSMKLVAVNPMLDFNLQDLFTKEIFQACSSNFALNEITSEVANSPYLDFNRLGTITNEVEMGFQRSIGAPVSIPHAFHGSSCITEQQNQTYLPWDQSDVQTLYNIDFQQARQQSFPSQKHTGIKLSYPFHVQKLKIDICHDRKIYPSNLYKLYRHDDSRRNVDKQYPFWKKKKIIFPFKMVAQVTIIKKKKQKY